MQYTVGMQYAVDVDAKRSTHTVDLVNMDGGDRYHTVGYAVGAQYAVGVQYTVSMQYAVDVGAKKSTHTVGVRSRCTVHSRCWCKKVNSHSGLSKYGWWGPLPLVQKGQNPYSRVCSVQLARSMH